MNTRNYTIDSMKFWCMLGVIYIHTSADRIDNILGTCLDILCRLAVPLFFVASGYTVYSKLDGTRIKRYATKLIKL